MITRLLRSLGNIFSVKTNEWEGVLLFFLLLTVFSYGVSFARSIGVTLVVHKLGGDALPYMFILTDLGIMIGSIVYAHYTRKSTGLAILGFFLLATTIFSLFAQALFFFNELWADHLNWVYGFFFVGFQFFYVLIFIHVGSVIASYFTAVQYKRVTSLIHAGLPIGGVLGGTSLVTMLELFRLRPERLVFMLGLACLGAYGVLYMIHARLSPVRASASEFRGSLNPFKELLAAYKYTLSSSLMVAMSLGLMLFVIGSKLLEYQYQVIIYPHIYEDVSARTAFLATYDIGANLLWLVIQLFVTTPIIVGIGVGASNLLHPILSTLASLGLFAFFYLNTTAMDMEQNALLMLGIAIFAQFINQEMRYALRAPANNLLFNAIPPNLWGINKAFLNGIVFPVSTLIASVFLILLAGNHPTLTEILAGKTSFIISLIALLVSLLGILAAFPQWTAYEKGVYGLLNRELFDKREVGSSKSGTLKQVIEEKLNSSDSYHVVAALEMIRVLRLSYFATQVGNLMLRKTTSLQIKEHCINTIASLPQTNTNITYLVEALRTEQDPQVLPSILRNLSQFKNVNFNQQIEKLLKHTSPAVFVEACLSLYAHPLYPRKHEIEKKILSRLSDPKSPNFALYLRALGELRQQRYSEYVLPYLDHKKSEISIAAFTAYIRMLEGQLEQHKSRLVAGLISPIKEIKINALRALKECQPLEDWTPVIHLLGAKDRTLVNESKELLRLNLNMCRQTLIEQAFSSRAAVQERFEILSLVYSRLSDAQQQRLREMADESLKSFIQINGLLKVHLSIRSHSRTYDLITKLLQEIAESHLLNVLTVITYASEQNLEFFQRVSRGLMSQSRANQGNALEVLTNAKEKYLVSRVLKYFDERLTDIQSISRVYGSLFNESLRVDQHNYEKHLLSLDHYLLRACLYYVKKERTGNLEVNRAHRKVRELLVDAPVKRLTVARPHAPASTPHTTASKSRPEPQKPSRFRAAAELLKNSVKKPT